MGQWMRVFFAVILCIGGSAWAEDITYGDDPGETPIQWVVDSDDYGVYGEHAIVGSTGSDTQKSDSITGNTITIKNVTVPPPEEPIQEDQIFQGYFHRYLEIYGAVNSLDSAPVIGNTVILENAVLDHYKSSPISPDLDYSSIYGGYAGPYHIYGSIDPNTPLPAPYDGSSVVNNNTVIIRNSIAGSATGGAAGSGDSWGLDSDFNLNRNIEASGNQVEVDGSTMESVYGGDAYLNGFYSRLEEQPDFSDSITVTASTNIFSNSNQVNVSDSRVGSVGGGDAHLYVDDSNYFYGYGDDRRPPADISTEFITVNGTLAATSNGNQIIFTNTLVEEDDDIEGGHASAGVIVSDESDFTVTATAKDNYVEINGSDTVASGEIIGGYSDVRSVFGTAAAIAEGNDVVINGGTVNSENDILMGGGAHSEGYHGYSWSSGLDPIDPTDDVETVLDIPDNFGTATTIGNSVTINGGSMTLREVAIVDDPNTSYDESQSGEADDVVAIVGGLSETETGLATASGNKLIITGGRVEVEGYGMGGGAAVSESGDAIATGNAVEITGGTVIGKIYGAGAASESGVATATNNTVTVSGTADLSNASLFGGGSFDGMEANHADNDFFTNNTLNILSDATIKAAQNFQNINFAYTGTSNLGTLNLSGGDVQLNVTDANTINYTGIFSGTGSLTKIGTGTLSFGSNQSIGGRMSVQSGALAISKSLSLTTNGGLLFGANSQFTPNGNTLTVLGGVTIDTGAYINLDTVDVGNTVLVSGDGIGGNFSYDSNFYETAMNAEKTELSVLREFTEQETSNNIIADLANSGVTMGKNGVKGIGQLASILDNVPGDVRNELEKQLKDLVALADSGDRDAAAAGVQQILGQYSTRATQATHTVSQSFGSAISGHLSQMRDNRIAQAGMNNAPGARSTRAYASMRGGRYSHSSAASRIWGGGFGSFASQDDDDGDFGYDYNSGGFILGYDHYFGDNLTVGFTGAYSHGTIDGNDGYSETSVDTLNFGAYASYDTQSGFYAEANLGFGLTWNDEDERLVLGGRRSGEFETSSFQLGGNVGYAFQLPAAFRIIPTIGLQYIHVDQDEYEQSGNVLAMWRDSSSADYLEVPVAVRVNRTFELGNGVSITPELRAAWIIEAKQDDVSVRTGFVGSNASMLVSGTNPGKHRGLVGLGAKARFGGSVDAFLNYNLEFRNNYTNHNIMAGVGVSF